MKKALAHIFLLGLLLQGGLAHAFVLPHAAMAVAAKEQGSRFAVSGEEGNSQISKDLVISDWEDLDDCDFDDTTSSLTNKGYFPVVASAREKLLAINHIRHTFSGTLYTDHNFSRLPRHNYISLRVLRI